MIKTVIGIIGIAILGFSVFVSWAMCKVSGQANESAERMLKEAIDNENKSL